MHGIEELKNVIKCGNTYDIENFQKPNHKIISVFGNTWNLGITSPEEDLSDFLSEASTTSATPLNPVFWLWKAANKAGSKVSVLELKTDRDIKVLVCSKVSIYSFVLSASRENMKTLVQEALLLLGE